MLESSLIGYLKEAFPSVPVYSFYIPEDAPSPAFCIENAGSGIATQRYNNDNIVSRVIKLTISSNSVSDIYNDKHLREYLESANTLGELKVLLVRINNFADSFNQEQKIFERTYTITIKIKESA
ncbi:hypothetical protein [Enterovibrio calviensis]|uniref:hypothetical protein n=1 Tax=Enterovibrio calviensis TaxID=91359 RepID=UPI00047F5A68|nr:hypothetical protein [Enterovibrio calviensis]